MNHNAKCTKVYRHTTIEDCFALTFFVVDSLVPLKIQIKFTVFLETFQSKLTKKDRSSWKDWIQFRWIQSNSEWNIRFNSEFRWGCFSFVLDQRRTLISNRTLLFCISLNYFTENYDNSSRFTSHSYKSCKSSGFCFLSNCLRWLFKSSRWFFAHDQLISKFSHWFHLKILWSNLIEKSSIKQWHRRTKMLENSNNFNSL